MGEISEEYQKRILEGKVRGDYEFIVIALFSFIVYGSAFFFLLIDSATSLLDS